jgi:cell division protein FtsB
MPILRTLRRAAIAMIAPTLFSGLTGYFVWQVSRGEHGLRNYHVREQQLVQAKQELAAAEALRDMWQTRVAGLQDRHIDPDTLDERARANLNLADPADLVVLYGPGKSLF